MEAYHLIHLDRQAYLDSTAKIIDLRTQNFAKMSLAWWDKHFNWKVHGCFVLADAQQTHLSYIFYIIDRYGNYLTIHNIFTPQAQRRKGYAKMLLSMIFDVALLRHVRRFKLTSISNSLDFYLSLGFVYWGINSVGDYYCDLPLPDAGLDGVDAMVITSTVAILAGKSLEKIYFKVKENELKLSSKQNGIYKKDQEKMKAHYLFKALTALQKP